VRVVEDRLRKVESHVKQLEDEHWKRNNPETKARTEGLASQLADAIAKLEDEVEAARASGDADRLTAAIEALDARKAWLGAIR
jgi:ribosome-associated translation inhibitor RaiA